MQDTQVVEAEPVKGRFTRAASEERELPGGAAAAPADRAERDPDRRRHRQRRVHPLPVHRLAGRARVPVGRRRRRPRAVLHQHGDRALHAGHRRDRDRRLHAHVEAVGRHPRGRRDPRHHVAGLGHVGRHHRDVRLRRRRPERDRHRRAARHRHHADGVTGRLPDRREAPVHQGRRRARAARGRPLRRDQRGRPIATRARSSRSFGTFPSEIPIAILVGALAAAGAGGANNLVQSNWIRDKGFGMGHYVPRIVSPITGQEEAAPDSERLSFPQDEANLGRWRTWWKRANTEQLVSFALIGGIAIIVFSLIAYSTVFEHPDLPGLERLRLHRARGRRARRHGRPRGSARCSWPSAPSACSPPRWGSSTTCRAWSPTSSTSATRATAAPSPRAGCTSRSSGAWSCSAARSCCSASTSRSC